MSSPTSSLKKGKKTPLPGVGNRPAPFRPTTTSEMEEKVLNDLLGRASSRQGTKSDSSVGRTSRNHLPKLRGSPTSAPNDFELMTSMMSKLSKLELQVQFYSKEIVDKDKKIKILQEKLELKDRYTTPVTSDLTSTKIKNLEKKCEELQKHVQEMEDFLADYGLIFVGSQNEEEDHKEGALYEEITDQSHSLMWNPGTACSSVPSGTEFRVDFDKVIKNVKELNILAREGEKMVQHTVKGAKLSTKQSIQLTLFANGIFMFNGPFRSYNEPQTQQCICDLMDGYFPSELQNRYPEGIPIQLTDRRDETFQDPRVTEQFPGVGQLLGGDTKPSRLVPTNLEQSSTELKQDKKERTLRTTKVHPGTQLTVDQFLNRLPSSVLKDGKIINVRSSIADEIKGGFTQSSSVKVIDSASLLENRGSAEKCIKSGHSPCDVPNRPLSSRSKVTTLRIKSEKGDDTYIVKMKYSETIMDLRRCLDSLRPSTSTPYDLVTTFPNKTYINLNMSLEDYGLIPNATMYIRTCVDNRLPLN